MIKDSSFDSKQTANSNVLSFSRYGKTLDKTSFNVAKKSKIDSTQSTSETSKRKKPANMFYIYPSQQQKEERNSYYDSKTVRKDSIGGQSTETKMPVNSNYIFKKIPRSCKQRSRLFEPEKIYDDKYLPRFDSVQTRQPSYSFRASKHPIQSEDQRNVKDEHDRSYFICQKNPILKWADSGLPAVKASLSNLNEVVEVENVKQDFKVGPICLSAQEMNLVEMRLEGAKRRKVPGHIKFSRRSPRKPLISQSFHTSEDYLNNFQQFRTSDKNTHDFKSSSPHDLYRQIFKDHQPSYDLLGVNYSRIYRRLDTGHIKFPNFVDKIKLKSDRADTPSFVKLDYSLPNSVARSPVQMKLQLKRNSNVFPTKHRQRIIVEEDLKDHLVQSVILSSDGQDRRIDFPVHTGIKV